MKWPWKKHKRGLRNVVLVRTVQSDGQSFDELVKPGKISRSWASVYRESVADYIEKVGVEVDIGETKCVVLSKHEVEKIRKGELR